MIKFVGGSTAVATFTNTSGPVAHFLNSTVNQTGNFTVASASMTWPAGTDITGYTNFRISHPPCGTTESTDTTIGDDVDETTIPHVCDDNYEECDVTVITDEDDDETIPGEDDDETTIADEESTTTTVAVIADVPTPPNAASGLIAPVVVAQTPLAAVAPATALPVTGSSNAGPTAMLGLFLLTAGLTLWGLARRPRALKS